MGIREYLGQERFIRFLELMGTPDMRVGQAFYIALGTEAADRIWQTKYDTFNSDDVEDVYAAIDFLLEH